MEDDDKDVEFKEDDQRDGGVDQGGGAEEAVGASLCRADEWWDSDGGGRRHNGESERCVSSRGSPRCSVAAATRTRLARVQALWRRSQNLLKTSSTEQVFGRFEGSLASK